MAKLINLEVNGFVKGGGFIDLIYPVGSIYISTNPTNPKDLFGQGVWESWGIGKTIVGVDTSQTEFNSVEKTGGTKTTKLRALIGAFNNNVLGLGYKATESVDNATSSDNKYNMTLEGNPAGTVNNINHSTVVRDVNGNDPSLLQPYITCYMWKRIS